MHHDSKRTSKLLQQIVTDCDGRALTVRQLMEMLGERTFALSAFIFGVLSTLVPGVSIVAALPIALVGFQMFLCRDYLWLPKKVANATLSEAMIVRGLGKAIPIIKKIEILFRPRLNFMFSPMGDRVMGLVFMLLACILMLPIPGMNFVPGVLVIALALSILERDGLMALVSVLVALIGMASTVEIIKLAITKMVG